MIETDPRHVSTEEEFVELFKEQFKFVYNYIYYHVGNVADSEDLTADVFVRAYAGRSSYCPYKGSRGAWLGGIARNIVRTHFKNKAKMPQITELPESIHADTDTENEYLRKELLRHVFAQMDKLPGRQRELLTMKYLLCLTNREIAQTMGMSESNVGVALHRAIKKLQKNLVSII